MSFLFYALSQFLSMIPRPQALSLGSVFAGFLYGLFRLSPYRHHAEPIIGGAFPTWSKVEQRRLFREHTQRLVWSIIDFLRFARLRLKPGAQRSGLPREIEIEGQQHYLEALERGKGVILVSAHFGCWEWIPAVSALRGDPTQVMVQKPSDPVMDRLFKRFRGFAGVKTVNNDSRKGLKQVIRALREGEVVGLVIDQHGESQQMLGDFFGHRVSFPTGPAAFAQRTGAAVVPVFIRWRGTQHQLSYFPARYLSPEQDPQVFTQDLYNIIEQQIRRYPANWLWTYNRWDKR
jgi:Kdo2-lipid IVA lauroyltransferase/acyltransferase